MKVKDDTSSPHLPAREEERGEGTSGLKPQKKGDSSRTSVDPLYETTDKYRRVLKPLKVEDFFKE